MERGEGFAWLSFWSILKTAGIFHCLTLLIDPTSAYYQCSVVYFTAYSSSLSRSLFLLFFPLDAYFAGLVLAKPSKNKLICLYILSVAVVQRSQNVVLSQTNSIQCLMCAEFLVASNRIAVFGRPHQDLRRTLCKILGSELQSSNEDFNMFAKENEREQERSEGAAINLGRDV